MIAYTKDQEKFWLRFSMIPIYNSENELSLGVYTEMLRKREIRKEKRTSDKELTQNNKDLKQFSYITSHNLRAPLSNLTVY
jgi:light-regulated signal transduction histidine kinase (bacteriophytochrome)